jgi:hypothetical protein
MEDQRMMRYWVFDESKLDNWLAEHEARRQAEDGATLQQVRDETAIIKAFLLGATPLQGPQIRTAAEIRAELECGKRA